MSEKADFTPISLVLFCQDWGKFILIIKTEDLWFSQVQWYYL